MKINEVSLGKVRQIIRKGNYKKFVKYKGGVMIKILLNSISFLPIPPNLGGMKNWGFEEKWRNWCSFLTISFHST